MRLFCLEVKRVLKSRRTLILIAVALVMSVVMAYLPIAFESINRPNQMEQKQNLMVWRQSNLSVIYILL